MIQRLAADLRAYFDDEGSPLVFIEGQPPIPEAILDKAIDQGLVSYGGGSGWSITDRIVLTAKGRQVLGFEKLPMLKRIASALLA